VPLGAPPARVAAEGARPILGALEHVEGGPSGSQGRSRRIRRTALRGVTAYLTNGMLKMNPGCSPRRYASGAFAAAMMWKMKVTIWAIQMSGTRIRFR